jgi:hypothetical protein
MSSDPNANISTGTAATVVNPQPSLATQSGTVIPDPPSPRKMMWMGVGLMAMAVLLFILLFKIWPPSPWPTDGATKALGQLPITFFDVTVFGRRLGLLYTSLDERLLLLVICAGALGSYVHTATSYSTYVGNRKFIASWTWWYLLRPFVGVSLSLIVYFSIRGGFLLLARVEEASQVNPYGVAAIAGLVGLFSKQASDKLNELFGTLFRPAPGEGDTVRRDSLLDGGTVIAPTVVRVGAGRVALLVSGINFVEASAVRLTPKADPTQAKDLKTSFVSSTQLVAYVEPGDTAQEAAFDVSVVTPPPGGGTTKPAELHVVTAS